MNAMQKFLAAGAVVVVAALPVAVAAQAIHARCDGYQVVSSQSSHGTAIFRAKVDRASQTIEYELNYSNLEGDIIQSHIHFSRPGSNGGIVLFLCTNAGNTRRNRDRDTACDGCGVPALRQPVPAAAGWDPEYFARGF